MLAAARGALAAIGACRRSALARAMRVAVLDDYGDAFRRTSAARALEAHGHSVLVQRGPAVLPQGLGDVEAVVLTQQRTRLDAALLSAMPRLRLVCQTGRYVAHIDLAGCAARGVVVCANATGGASIATAELTWALVLAASRHVVTEANALRAGRWQSTVGRALAGRTLGIYGYGRIGAQVARYGQAFGMRVVVHGREGSQARARAEGFEVVPRDVLFSGSDVLCLHVALTEETRGLVTRTDLASMRPDALLVNTARSALVEPGALVEALRAGRPGFAAVDVFDREPVLDAADPLFALPNVLATPHLGYAEKTSYEALYAPIAAQILDFATGRTPSGVVVGAKQP